MKGWAKFMLWRIALLWLMLIVYVLSTAVLHSEILKWGVFGLYILMWLNFVWGAKKYAEAIKALKVFREKTPAG